MTEVQSQGDKLRGERVYISAKSIAPPRLSKNTRSGRHKREETTARYNVVCVVEVPWVLAASTATTPAAGPKPK
jgi:hypothetical protein